MMEWIEMGFLCNERHQDGCGFDSGAGTCLCEVACSACVANWELNCP